MLNNVTDMQIIQGSVVTLHLNHGQGSALTLDIQEIKDSNCRPQDTNLNILVRLIQIQRIRVLELNRFQRPKFSAYKRFL